MRFASSRWRSLLVTLVALFVACVFRIAHSQTLSPSSFVCTLPIHTLSFACDGACGSDAFTSCLRTTNRSTSTQSFASSRCGYECFRIAKSASKFVFLVPFGRWKSPQERAELVSRTLGSYANDTSVFPSESNDLLRKIAKLALPKETTYISIQGGVTVESQSVVSKGRVANVQFALDLFTDEPQVDNVWLNNLNLAPISSNLSRILPLKLVNLSLDNGLFRAIPTGLSRFKNLRMLSMAKNYVTSVKDSEALDALTMLNLNQNNIHTFNAVFSSLVELNLEMNFLTDFPATLSRYSRLEKLILRNNDIGALRNSNGIPSLKYLDLEFTNLTRFEARFPNLETLSLNHNQLTEIPPVLFSFTKLANLYIGSNNFTNLTITEMQATFLTGLKNFTMDPEALNTNCSNATRQREIHGLTFCITNFADFSSALPPASQRQEMGDDPGISLMSVLLGVFFGVAVVAVVLGFVALRRRNFKRNSKLATPTTVGMGPALTFQNGSSLWQDAELLAVRVSADDIKDVRKIGSGVSGDVWLVRYRQTQLLASKRMRNGDATRARIHSFMAEIKIAAKLEHPNIVKFKGAAWTIEATLQALFECMEGGDLRTYLENENTPRGWTSVKVQIATGIAQALVYVHSLSPPLVHGCLRSRSVLLSTNFEAKLTDFGVLHENSMMTTADVTTARWLAPEVISGGNNYGPAADIFSFGAVLSELFSHALPYEDALSVDETRLSEVELLQLISAGELQPTFSNDLCPDKIASLGQRCVAFDPRDRPSATEVATELRMAKESMFVEL